MWIVDGILNCVNDEQAYNVLSLISVTLSGIYISLWNDQSLNANFPIYISQFLVYLYTSIKNVQLSNKKSSINSRFFGNAFFLVKNNLQKHQN